MQIAVQSIQVDQQGTMVLGKGAGGVGEAGAGEEGVVNRPSLTDDIRKIPQEPG